MKLKHLLVLAPHPCLYPCHLPSVALLFRDPADLSSYFSTQAPLVNSACCSHSYHLCHLLCKDMRFYLSRLLFRSENLATLQLWFLWPEQCWGCVWNLNVGAMIDHTTSLHHVPSTRSVPTFTRQPCILQCLSWVQHMHTWQMQTWTPELFRLCLLHEGLECWG